jgi:hypothetical protein
MTTTELTHKQAFQLRMIDAQFGCRAERFRFDDAPLYALGFVRKYNGNYDNDDICLTDAGRESLAAYDAKYRIVEVEALSVLVEFIEDGLASCGESHPGKVAQFDYLRKAVAKAREALRD